MQRIIRATGVLAIAMLANTGLSTVTHAQSPAGQWLVDYDRKVSGSDGAATQRTRARLTLVQTGDSLTGQWQVVSPVRPGDVPRKLTGNVRNGVIQLVGAPVEAIVRRHIFESKVMLTPKYRLSIAGDSITGMMIAMSEDGSIKAPAVVFEGTRERR